MISPDSTHDPHPRGRFHRFAHDAMACTFEVALVSDDAKYARQAADAAFAEVDRLEQLLSRFIPHSEIAQLCHRAPGQSVAVSPATIACLQLASTVHAWTRGAFDIAYRSRPAWRAAGYPTDDPPLVFDPTARRVGVRLPGVDLDLGALGKGYAVDRAVEILSEWGFSAGLVHSGQSSVRAFGRSPDGTLWRVALRASSSPESPPGDGPAHDPSEHAARHALRNPAPVPLPVEHGPDAGGGGPVCASVELADKALGGSGQLLHGRHIIDPRTGTPAGTATAAWCLAPNAALADALSTAFMILKREEIEEVCARAAVTAIILIGPGQPLLCLGPDSRAIQPLGTRGS